MSSLSTSHPSDDILDEFVAALTPDSQAAVARKYHDWAQHIQDCEERCLMAVVALKRDLLLGDHPIPADIASLPERERLELFKEARRLG